MAEPMPSYEEWPDTYDVLYEAIMEKRFMSSNWVYDIYAMHNKFKVHPIMREMDKDKLEQFLQFRIRFLEEELNELKNAKGAEDVVDALIDLCVVAIGTLDAFDVNASKAWEEVLEANMNKEPGIKESRPNPLGLPDLIKPPGWVGPDHTGNHGMLTKIF
jgi:hypothetical protein